MKKTFFLAAFIPAVFAILVSCASTKKEASAAEVKTENTTTVSTTTVSTVEEEKPFELVYSDYESEVPFADITAMELVNKMETGWNLGNTFDAPGETAWGQPRTTKAMLDGLVASGIKTIRIPVSWSRHMNRKTGVIDSMWMNRVKTVVDWALEDGLYVIINSHHDNYNSQTEMPAIMGYYPNTTNCEKSIRYLTYVWTQVGEVFKDYDERLIFETMNEPRPIGTNYEWWYDRNNSICKDAAATLNKLNQAALNAIRASGGNNKKRFVMIPGLRAAVSSVLDGSFILPEDNVPGKLIMSVHMYDPQDFAMNTPGSKIFTESHKAALKRTFDSLNTKYISQGIPVVVGEYGATNKGNTEERVKWFDFFLTQGRSLGICACLWDNNGWQPSEAQGERFGYYNRLEQKWYEPAIIEKIQEVMSKD